MGHVVNGTKYAQLHVHEQTAQLRCLMTTLYDKQCTPGDWVFTADRVSRIMVEFALNFLPIESNSVITTVEDEPFDGVKFAGRIVGVSIIRAGEAMETALRSCCRNVRLGKILVQRDERTTQPHYYMAKLPKDVATRHVLLMDPMLATGGTAIMAVEKLVEAGVPQEKVIFVNIVAAPEGITALLERFPSIQICTAAVAEGLNEHKYIRRSLGDFGDRYFGTVHKAT